MSLIPSKVDDFVLCSQLGSVHLGVCRVNILRDYGQCREETKTRLGEEETFPLLTSFETLVRLG